MVTMNTLLHDELGRGPNYEHSYYITLHIDPLGANEIHISCRISPTHVAAILEA